MTHKEAHASVNRRCDNRTLRSVLPFPKQETGGWSMSRSSALRVVLSIVCPGGLLLALLVLLGGPVLASAGQPSPIPASLPVHTATSAQPPHFEGAQAAANRTSSLSQSGPVAGQPATSEEDTIAPDLSDQTPDTLVRPWQQPPTAHAAAAAQVAALSIPPITFVANAHWVYGHTVEPNAGVELIVTQEGATVGRSRTRSDNTGYFAMDTMNLQGRYLNLEPGMDVRVIEDIRGPWADPNPRPSKRESWIRTPIQSQARSRACLCRPTSKFPLRVQHSM